MKSLGKPLSRRAFAGSALAAGAFAATRGVAQTSAPVPTMDSQMGPFYPLGYSGEDDFDMTMLKGRPARALGEVIEVTGRVLDRYGNPMKNAAIEIWQANHVGRYDHANDQSPAPLDPNFQGVARLVTGTSGEWRIKTIKPKFYDTPLGMRTPQKSTASRSLSCTGARASASATAATPPDRWRWMAAAARRPSPTACTTVPAPRTISPPANTRATFVACEAASAGSSEPTRLPRFLMPLI